MTKITEQDKITLGQDLVSYINNVNDVNFKISMYLHEGGHHDAAAYLSEFDKRVKATPYTPTITLTQLELGPELMSHLLIANREKLMFERSMSLHKGGYHDAATYLSEFDKKAGVANKDVSTTMFVAKGESGEQFIVYTSQKTVGNIKAVRDEANGIDPVPSTPSSP